MRLFLIPISTRRTLLYCKKTTGGVATQLSVIDRITNKAAVTWAQWEEAEQGWKKALTTYGHRVLQKIPYEEWGLKSVPPLSAKREAQELKSHSPVELLYPGNVIHQSRILGTLRKLATERQDLHRRRMWWSLGVAPLTAPIALIPLIPNIPFFYLAYRGWSHWRALNGSKHLEFLLDNHLVNPTSLPGLEDLYSRHQGLLPKLPPDETPVVDEKSGSNQQPQDDPPDETILLDISDGKDLAKMLQAPELHAEVERAVTQVRHLLNLKKQPK
ncbi:hypothetical protein D8B26_005729 [Coccidioides posadasii str. Silveira]|uniref:Uncharacterized protein n=3 Tax=Coccidioides posadasii TaxID=199306 RepID=E9DAQ3_COCPS|nr:hypothetical protein CPC735_025230 [Coccidioides posadasii C735 delta SOWgp]EER27187.1 hypothetical protein CPC735_025230 [Coccidioides posadasii C735 delta SOWgp]EFW16389.1 conserved hypothetical protein [Coccidioides posadasii str. Silveira]KMM66924.1 hypothetical protein CPAG_03260 [Coccidioides posadasii RMSCC 3488]QVM11079.1 hypothetical protein D8B26_005729 [Coccidioides posadasii str. Silveira]|eukprot:XP_003069332.1 hypothetical protein CPC735_025230 [Coccidioides posadasii C735 delta SOWgp]